LIFSQKRAATAGERIKLEKCPLIEKFYGQEEKVEQPTEAAAPSPAAVAQDKKLTAIKVWSATLIDNELKPALIESAKAVKAASSVQE
jgi:hypothetical protein